MTKEIIISIIIVIAVILFDILSSNYTKQSRQELENCFEEMKIDNHRSFKESSIDLKNLMNKKLIIK